MQINDYISTLTSIATLVTAAVGAIGAILALRQGQRNHTIGLKNQQDLANTQVAIDEQHKATNSRLTELIKKTAEASDAIGHARGIEDERVRKA
jgi:hypothetical protein